jgi:hypothetical protein
MQNLQIFQRRVNQKFLSIILFGVVFLIGLGICLSTKSNYLLDDAFITFRYSQHLAGGQGIVWNIGEAPIQGYTNFLFMILVSLGFKLGISPVLMALGLNIIGLFMICLTSFFLLRKIPHSIIFRLLLVLAICLYPNTTENLHTGLETVFWTGLIFLGFFLIEEPYSQPKLWGFIITMSAAVLTRPETVFFAAIWLVIAFAKNVNERKTIVFGGIVFIGVICCYELFNKIYFGAFLPNSALIKLNNPLILPGRDYLKQFFSEHLSLIIISLVVLFFGVIFQRKNRIISMNLLGFLSLPFFYLFTNPLMGMFSRFLFPLLIALLFIIFAVVSFLISNLIQEGQSPQFERFKQARKVSFLLLLLIPFFFLFRFEVNQYISDLKNPYTQPLLETEIKIGKELAKIPDAKNISIAFGDSGSIPYYSGVHFIDLVGLNDSNIANNANSLGPDWVIQYVMNKQPDLIGFYLLPNKEIFNAGHGVIGTSYSALYAAMKDKYQVVGAYDCSWVILVFFVREDSPIRSELENGFSQIPGNQIDIRFH